MPTQADVLFGEIVGADTHADLYGSSPGGYVMDTTGGGHETADPAQHVAALAAAGPKALFGPSGPLFWMGLFLVGAVGLNGFRK